jgi:hypothetical protein
MPIAQIALSKAPIAYASQRDFRSQIQPPASDPKAVKSPPANPLIHTTVITEA